MGTDRVEHEAEHERRAVREHARSPEGRADRKAPLRRRKVRIELADLEQPDRGVEPFQRDRETHQSALASLPLRPCNELLVALDRRGRRRHEARHFFAGEHRQQRGGVRDPQLAQDDLAAGQRRQAIAPLRA